MEELSANTKLEIAVEILAAKIAICSRKETKEKDKEMKMLMSEREEMYTGNEDVINKIITVYGPEIKKNYENV